MPIGAKNGELIIKRLSNKPEKVHANNVIAVNNKDSVMYLLKEKAHGRQISLIWIPETMLKI